MPKVSVLMPVYKTNEAYLQEAIESVLNQTYIDFEFLILDDCPEDSREAVVKSYDDPRIKYFKNEYNLGITPSRNKLIDLAHGEYLAVFDHDDICMPTRLEKQVAFLDAHPFYGVVSSNVEFFLQGYATKWPTENLDIKIALMNDCAVGHTASMLRKSILDKYKICYEEDFSPAEDWMIMLRLLKITMFHNIQEPLVRYRYSEDNTTHKQRKKMDDAAVMCRCFASREFPYLWSIFKETCPKPKKIVWVRLFNFLPILKLVGKANKCKAFLFGFIPLFSYKGEK